MNLTIDNVREAILFLIALILSITVHEFGHAWAATKLGDRLPQSQGRLSLSPRTHVDPIGTLVFPLIMHFTGAPLLGWGRPVLTNPTAYTRRISRPMGSMLVAIAGPLMNLVLAFLVSVVIVVAVRTGVMSLGLAQTLVGHLVLLNLTLLFFNMLPIPPLDGGAVLAWVLPRSLQSIVDFLQKWGFFLLFALMFTGGLGFLMTPGIIASRWWVELLREAAGR